MVGFWYTVSNQIVLVMIQNGWEVNLVKNNSLADKVANEIVRTIIGKELKAGDKLPNEFELAKALGVGRSTVREAVKTLVSRNVVEIRRGSGTFVSVQSGVSEDPLGLEFLGDSARVRMDLLKMRWMLEPRLASLAAANADEQDAERIQQACRACEEAEDYAAAYQQLHAAVAGASGNTVAPNLIAVLGQLRLVPDAQERAQLVESQREIARAVCAHDGAGAYDAMVLHLTLYRKILTAELLK